MADGSFIKEFCDELTCSVCLEYFTDPVTTDCGHNFCRACLIQSWELPGSDASCPLCRDPVQQRNLKPNRQLANIVEISKKFSLQVAKGAEVPGRVCERHQEPLKLFCREDETPICVVCERSKEHKEHEMIPTDEAAEEYKAKIQTRLPSLEKEREKLVELKVTEEQRKEKCLKQLEMEKQEIKAIFEQMNQKKILWLTELAILEEEIKKMEEEIVIGFSMQISHFSDLIKDVKVKCQQPPSEFLQDIRSTLSRCQEGQAREDLKAKENLSSGLEWHVRSFCLKSSAFKRTLEEFEGSLNQAPNKVNVTLDPDTANPNLFISQDLKSVDYRIDKYVLPDTPERFDKMSCVLGCESFTSGRHWWEVNIIFNKLTWLFSSRKCERWAVGVALESLRRKGSFNISPLLGIWAIGKDSSQPNQLWAFTVPEKIPLSHQSPQIRVFLDHKEGCVEFFDAKTDNLIFSFPSASFSGERIRPFFWVESKARLKC